MSNYTKTTDFASKDSLPDGDPSKVIKGTEHDDEYNNIETAIATKADKNNSALTGTATAEGLTVSGTLSITGTLSASGVTIDGGTF